MNNKDMGKKYFETRKDSLEDSVKNIFGNTISSEQNKFNEAAKAATDAGKEYFVVNGLQHKTPVAEAKEVAKEITDKQKKLPKALQAAIKKKEDDDKSMKEDSLDKVNPKAVKKKFDDRKDKDIDNDGDVDSSDKFLHKRRKAISKAISKEEVSEAYWKVSIPDMTPIFVETGSKSDIMKDMRKKLKTDALKGLEIERVSKSTMIKMYRELAKGGGEEEEPKKEETTMSKVFSQVRNMMKEKKKKMIKGYTSKY